MFKKIFFFLFLISSVSIPGYYFYQRSKSKKEESYPVNNKEEVQEEEEGKFQEVAEEEVPLVEINGWLDWLLLNTILFFLTIFFLYVLFPRGVQLTVTNETNKVTNDQLKDFFVDYLGKEKFTKEEVDTEISNLEQQLQGFDPDNKEDLDKLQQFKRLRILYPIKYCFDNGKFYLRNRFLNDFIQWEAHNGHLKIEFPIIFFIISLIITHIFLGYDLYFFLQSFWQVGFSKTFEKFHWLDLFSITKVFRRNSIIKKIAFLIALIFITGVTFVLTIKVYDKEYKKENVLNSMTEKLQKKLDNGKFISFLPPEEVEQIRDEALKKLTKKNP